MTPQSIATIATFLTLTSLLGTFFQVQLATWLRDLMTLKSKYELNAGDNPTADEIKALRECAYTLSGLYNKVPACSAATSCGAAMPSAANYTATCSKASARRSACC